VPMKTLRKISKFFSWPMANLLRKLEEEGRVEKGAR